MSFDTTNTTKIKRVMKVDVKLLAKKICQYNGQKGTEKQVGKCLRSFSYNVGIMQQFADGRFNY